MRLAFASSDSPGLPFPNRRSKTDRGSQSFTTGVLSFRQERFALNEIPKKVEKPWGHEIWWARTERYVGKILHVKKGESLSLQYHNVKDETILIQSGKLLFEVGTAGQEGALRKVEMNPGDVYHITPGTLHRMKDLNPGFPKDQHKKQTIVTAEVKWPEVLASNVRQLAKENYP